MAARVVPQLLAGDMLLLRYLPQKWSWFESPVLSTKGNGELPTFPLGREPLQQQVIKPEGFDGTTKLGEYLHHFDICVKVKGWTRSEAGAYLG